ncbi:MAG TPA: cupin domain-containing protein [Anaeromyxobacter sp.]
MATTPRFDDVEWIARTDTVGVRVNTLAPGQATPWHIHTEVADDVFCLETPIEVGLRHPDETVTLAPGQRRHIPVRRVHRVANRGRTAARYLLVQATGRYDFNAGPEEREQRIGGGADAPPALPGPPAADRPERWPRPEIR